MNKQQLANKIWNSANQMRSKIEAKRYSVDTDNTYSMVGWYKVNDDGTLELYNFSSPVTENLTLRALWRVVGEYHVKYSVEGVDFNGDPMYTMAIGTMEMELYTLSIMRRLIPEQ